MSAVSLAHLATHIPSVRDTICRIPIPPDNWHLCVRNTSHLLLQLCHFGIALRSTTFHELKSTCHLALTRAIDAVGSRCSHNATSRSLFFAHAGIDDGSDGKVAEKGTSIGSWCGNGRKCARFGRASGCVAGADFGSKGILRDEEWFAVLERGAQ